MDPEVKQSPAEQPKFVKFLAVAIISSMILGAVFGAAAGFFASAMVSGTGSIKARLAYSLKEISNGRQGIVEEQKKIVKTEEESNVIAVAEKASPAVVSIIVTKDLPVIERYYNDSSGGSDLFQQFFGDDFGGFFGVPQYRQNGTQKQEVGGGTGFIVSADGYIVTNKHVVADEAAEYTVLLNDERKLPAKVLARDPMTDLAILKIDAKNLPTLSLGDSAKVKVGQTVIAIGNALGEFRNTVSTGVVSGLARSIIAGGAGMDSEELAGVIQTDASINSGNSGGPLLNLAGEVIGINTAVAQNAQGIGFAIPINEVKNTIDSVKKNGRIIRPWLGVRYVMIDAELAKTNQLTVDYGALIVKGNTAAELAVSPGSPADKAGLVENDIILEMNGQKINDKYPLAKAISQFRAGDEVTLKVTHKGETKEVKVRLGEMK